MFSWATKEYLLDCMSIEQIVYYHEIGWKAEETTAMVFWGTYGKLTNGDDTKKESRFEFRKAHPDGEIHENGAWSVSR